MKNHLRRKLLKTTLAGLSLGGADLFWPAMLGGLNKVALAQSLPDIKNTLVKGPLIVVFQRGAADGLNILSPLDDGHFLAARPPEMRFNRDQAAGSITSESFKFYWHPEASAFADLFEKRQMAIWPAAGIANETRSHFEAQEIIERGLNSLNHVPDNRGWLTRQIQGEESKDSRAISLFAGSTNLPRSMQGSHKAIAIRDLQNGINVPNGQSGIANLAALCAADKQHSGISLTMSTHLESIVKISSSLPKSADNKILAHQTAGKVDYPHSDPGIGLRSVARLIVSRVGLQYAWIDQTGWDTHESQQGRMNGVVKNLSQSIDAFRQDMQARNEPYTLLIMTEFGRRLRSNRSNGTDHGHGSLAMVIGSNLLGGQVLGKWPGLDTDSLDRGVDLAVANEHQSIIAQALRWRGSIV